MKIHDKVQILKLATFLAMFGFGFAHAQTMTANGKPINLCIFNESYAVENSNGGLAAAKKFKTEADAKTKPLEARRDEMQKQAADVKKQESILDPPVLEKKKREIDEMYFKLSQDAMALEKQLNELKRNLFGPVFEQTFAALNEVSKKRGCTLVLDTIAIRGIAQELNEEIDLTKEVISVVNQGKSSSTQTKPSSGKGSNKTKTEKAQ